MTITLGWWIIPTIITIGSVIWVRVESSKGGYFAGVFEFYGASIMTLLSWLIYFVIF